MIIYMMRRIYFLLFIHQIYSIAVIQVHVSEDSSNSWIVHNENEGFIVDCGCYWEHGLMLGQTWREKFPDGLLPSFIYLTHTHPENFLGLVSLLYELNTTQLPVYISNSAALDEIDYWLDIWNRSNPFERSILLDERQSPNQFSYKNHIKVLDHPLMMFNREQIHIISNFPVAESMHASMLYVRSIGALFTGDLVVTRSHLFVSPSDPYPDSDHHVCNWIGILQSLRCTFPESTRIYPAHGDGPTASMSFVETIETNIRWLTYMRAFIFNSCNVTFVMRMLEDVFPNYTNIEQSRASLANRIPYSAMALGCKCSHNMTSTCGGLQPPTCLFLPKNKTQSLDTIALPLGCIHRASSSCIDHNIRYAFFFLILSTNILLNIF